MTEADIQLAERLADAAGAAIRPFFRKPFAMEAKADATPVTEADRAAEAAMRAILKEERPADGIIGEEYGRQAGESGRVWVLDPIDGTRSFIAGRAIFGTLIALLEGDMPVLGVINQPVARERWVGVSGRPTLFNGVAVSTRSCASLADALLATTSPYLFEQAERAIFDKLAGACANIVLGGDCYAYGTLALGMTDIVCESGLKIHDFAALVPIVEGAGGMVCDWDGEPLHAGSAGRVIALGDAALLPALREILGSAG